MKPPSARQKLMRAAMWFYETVIGTSETYARSDFTKQVACRAGASAISPRGVTLIFAQEFLRSNNDLSS
jgi:hypothetical protein